MARNTSIALSDHFTDFIDARVAEGRYGSASDVVRAGLRLLEEHEARLKALHDAIDEGEASGIMDDFDNEAFKREMREKYGGRNG